MARAQVLKSFTLKSHQKQQMLVGGEERKNKEEMHQELQDQDLLGSPHLEEEWIGGNIDLDLLSLSLKDIQESWEGLRGRQAFPSVNNGEEEREK